MIATPVIPGKSYRVQGFGLDVTVLAAHPIDAIIQIVAEAANG